MNNKKVTSIDNDNEVNELKKQVSILCGEVRELSGKLTNSEAIKTHFISNVCNEIVNPFASIMGLSRNIVNYGGDDMSRVKNMAEMIYSEAFDLDFQLKNIFAAAHIEAGECEPAYAKIDIVQLVDNVISIYKYKAGQKQLTINFEVDVDAELAESKMFVTDAEKLQLVLSNVLSNSVKFSNASNKVEVKLSFESESLCIAIKDYGIGINKEKMAMVFNRFERIDKEINSVNQGSGLGLSVAKAYVECLNGTIEVEGGVDCGTIVTVKLPEPSQCPESDLNDDEFIF